MRTEAWNGEGGSGGRVPSLAQVTSFAGWKREQDRVRVRWAEASTEHRNQMSVFELEDGGQAGNKRGAAGSGKP